jgi:hypothetical protein
LAAGEFAGAGAALAHVVAGADRAGLGFVTGVQGLLAGFIHGRLAWMRPF